MTPPPADHRLDGDRSAFSERLNSLDPGLFAAVGLPGTVSDPESLLAVHLACRATYGTFDYLEIGSYMGASLQAFLADERCLSVVSIDPRPPSAPDMRGRVSWPHNTTEAMIERLRGVRGVDLTKLRTIEASTEDLAPADIGSRPQLCFIDAEHTREAALRDARFCRAAVADDGAVMFHDRLIVREAIAEFVDELATAGASFTAYPLAGALFIVEVGAPRLISCTCVRARIPFLSLWRTTQDTGHDAARVRRLLRLEHEARKFERRAREHAPAWAKRLFRLIRRRRPRPVNGAPRGRLSTESDPRPCRHSN